MSEAKWASTIVTTPAGRLWIITVEKSVWSADFEARWPNQKARALAALEIDLDPGERHRERSPSLARARTAITRYFKGDFSELSDIPVDLEGPPFHRRVWNTVRKVGPGKTLTYKQLAKRSKKEGAFRAIGAANGANPCALFVPCHRIVGTGGALVGYGAGLEIKAFLLNHEGIPNDGKRLT